MAESKASLLLELKDFVSSQLEKVSSRMEKLRQNALAVAASFVTFTTAIYKTLSAAGEEERAIIRLSNALSNIPGVSAGATDRLVKLAGEMQKLTGIPDDAVVSMQALLASFRLNEQAIAALTPRILDISARMGIDMTSAAMQLGKAIQTGEVGMLRRLGISVDETALKMGNLEAVIDSISENFNGAAAAAGNSILGTFNKLKAAVGDTFEQFGYALYQYLRPFIVGITNLIVKFNESETPIKKWVAAFLLVGAAVTGVATAFVAISALIPAVVAGFGLLTSPALLIASALGAAAISVTALIANFGNLRSVVLTAAQDIVKGLGFIGQSVLSIMRGDFAGAMENGKQAAFAFSDATIGAFYEAKTGISQQIDDLKKKLMEPLPPPQISSGEGAARVATSADFNSDEFQKKILAIQGFNEAIAELEMNNYAQRLEAQNQFERARELRATYYKQRSIDSARSMFAAIGSIQATKNAELVTIVKAANIAQAIMDTYVGANKALAQLGAWGFPVAAAIVAAGMANVATIAGVELAEGGMVMARSGGVPAILGEAGRDEVAIPLDDPRTQERLRDALGGGGTTIIQAGVIVADEGGLRELARRIDEHLYKMERNRTRLS